MTSLIVIAGAAVIFYIMRRWAAEDNTHVYDDPDYEFGPDKDHWWQ